MRDCGFLAVDRRFLTDGDVAGDKTWPGVFPFDSHTHPCHRTSKTSTPASTTLAMVAQRRLDTAEVTGDVATGDGDTSIASRTT